MQKKTLISLAKASGRFCRMRLMLRRATHWTSGAEDTSVTMYREGGGGAGGKCVRGD